MRWRAFGGRGRSTRRGGAPRPRSGRSRRGRSGRWCRRGASAGGPGRRRRRRRSPGRSGRRVRAAPEEGLCGDQRVHVEADRAGRATGGDEALDAGGRSGRGRRGQAGAVTGGPHRAAAPGHVGADGAHLVRHGRSPRRGGPNSCFGRMCWMAGGRRSLPGAVGEGGEECLHRGPDGDRGRTTVVHRVLYSATAFAMSNDDQTVSSGTPTVKRSAAPTCPYPLDAAPFAGQEGPRDHAGDRFRPGHTHREHLGTFGQDCSTGYADRARSAPTTRAAGSPPCTPRPAAKPCWPTCRSGGAPRCWRRPGCGSRPRTLAAGPKPEKAAPPARPTASPRSACANSCPC